MQCGARVALQGPSGSAPVRMQCACCALAASARNLAVTSQDEYQPTPDAERELPPLDGTHGLGPPGPSGAAGLTDMPDAWARHVAGEPSPSGSLSLAASPASLRGAETMDLVTAASLELGDGRQPAAAGATDDFDELARQELLSGVLMGEQTAGPSLAGKRTLPEQVQGVHPTARSACLGAWGQE